MNPSSVLRFLSPASVLRSSRLVVGPAVFSFCLGLAAVASEDLPVPFEAVDPLSVEVSVQRVTVDAAGRENLVAVETVQPGDVLVYTVTYHNSGARRLRGVTPKVPMPAGMGYLQDSAAPAVSAYTTDGRTYQVLAGGETAVPAGARGLGWAPLNLAPRSKQEIRFRATVADATFLVASR